MKRVTNDNRENVVHKIMVWLREDALHIIGKWRNLGFAHLFDPAGLVLARDLEYSHQTAHLPHNADD